MSGFSLSARKMVKAATLFSGRLLITVRAWVWAGMCLCVSDGWKEKKMYRLLEGHKKSDHSRFPITVQYAMNGAKKKPQKTQLR